MKTNHTSDGIQKNTSARAEQSDEKEYIHLMPFKRIHLQEQSEVAQPAAPIPPLEVKKQ
jgi:hypothetical protein